jgi:hypothetical protein
MKDWNATGDAESIFHGIQISRCRTHALALLAALGATGSGFLTSCTGLSRPPLPDTVALWMAAFARGNAGWRPLCPLVHQ